MAATARSAVRADILEKYAETSIACESDFAYLKRVGSDNTLHHLSVCPADEFASPLQADEAAAFADEVRPRERNVAQDALVGGVLGFALVKAA